MSRQKGNRTKRKAIKYLEDLGYIVDTVELTGKWTSHKDLFLIIALTVGNERMSVVIRKMNLKGLIL